MFKDIFSFDKEKYENMLDDPNSKWGKILDNFITFLVIIFPFVFIFESIWNNSINYGNKFLIFNFFLSIVFAAEYIYRLICAKNKIKFIKNPMRIIDFLSFFPFFAWFYTSWNILALLKTFKVLKVLKLIKKIPLTSGFLKELKEYKWEFFAIFLLYFVLLFIFSSFVYYAERWISNTEFTSIPQSLWWWLVTMASLWYWDIVPATNIWKIIWSILVFLWPILWALIWWITIVVFMDISEDIEKAKIKRWKHCKRCQKLNPRNANYCMQCWKKLLEEKKD